MHTNPANLQFTRMVTGVRRISRTRGGTKSAAGERGTHVIAASSFVGAPARGGLARLALQPWVGLLSERNRRSRRGGDPGHGIDGPNLTDFAIARGPW